MAFGVRHQSACATRQSAASCSAAVAGVRVSGYRAGHGRSCFDVAGRSGGSANAAVPVFFPSNGDVTQTKRHPENQGRFNLGRKALTARTVRQASRGPWRAPT